MPTKHGFLGGMIQMMRKDDKQGETRTTTYTAFSSRPAHVLPPPIYHLIQALPPSLPRPHPHHTRSGIQYHRMSEAILVITYRAPFIRMWANEAVTTHIWPRIATLLFLATTLVCPQVRPTIFAPFTSAIPPVSNCTRSFHVHSRVILLMTPYAVNLLGWSFENCA